MFLARVFRRPVVASSTASHKLRAGLQDFFELGRGPEFDKPPVYGRAWRAKELRLKSWEDLHKLWYVLVKEKNMLLTQKQILTSHNMNFPNPERMPKVRVSMCRLKQVLTERAIKEPNLRKRSDMKKLINAL
ncbi:hypothetical protein GOP47_0007006 [Adiantum capillus-veneris]|uniref:Large ribosomal subunit protein uL29m n=1 Tax=Adiantum capillus-veneris TaxID=13818 RepID=A0A9D4ZKH6_ADICA|nr:hypothetical protein GOP47_0007006 [Adiantum capillus-veneris]